MERWPPAYDADELQEMIRKLSASVDRTLYAPSIVAGGPVCQGDVIQLTAEIPVLDREGVPGLLPEVAEHWLVVGNTCDFGRDVTDVRWTQVVPIMAEEPLDLIPPNTLEAFRRYLYSRRFYVPPWRDASNVLRYADFLTPVALDKGALAGGHAKVVARFSREWWMLLHACLVRFLCRDDGRFDE